MSRLGVDDDGVDWDAELMKEVQRDPDILDQFATPPHINGAIRWAILAVVGALFAGCAVAISILGSA